MGRKKIQISRITDERNRQVTFNKRKFGVMKKAYELSVLCDCEIALIIFSSSNKLYQYASTDMDKVLLKYTEYNEPHESLTNKNIIEKEHKNGVMSPDSPEPDADFQLTPRTEAKYSKIDEEFQMMMQRNQINGQRVGMGASNYTMPVTVPANSSYNDSVLLQSSPQMAHTSISPRPSSSETDSGNFYPSGSMLEISNGYPNSSSPLGGSPSPGPSPGPIGKSGMLHPPRQHSPIPRTNLRVVIPTVLGPSINQNDDVSYNDNHHNKMSTSSLNTPVVALQTPSIPGLSYPSSMTSFSAQDFSMSTDIGLGSLPWSTQQQLQTSLAHQSYTVFRYSALPHLAVSSSTPPPSSSPLPMKIKSEPISPPRDHHGAGGGSISCGSVQTGGNGPTSTGSTMHMSGNSLGLSASPHSLNLSHTHHSLPRPNSTGHLTPTSGTITPTNMPSPGSGGVGDNRHSGSSDYDSGPMMKRSRVGENWAT
ncbi:myocyte-specific enhancer factor 2 isoform X3 [Chrysoperla carnea]|uniref:myocyte-specific enhancer factor 2 isoform X3 n=1 Tax=Chrysoperla carnea TaxID=189513 RepID=UPI001D07A8E5|nr:myocyte-specific enhancer factor 2 isoform X3 [Chrysoperla carnea]